MPREPSHATGTVTLDNGTPAKSVSVRVFHRGFGNVDTQLGQDTRTDDSGHYAFEYTPTTTPTNLVVAVLGADGKLVKPFSLVRYNASENEVIDLVDIPTSVQPPRSEYHRLSTALSPHLGGAEQLADAQETDDRQDLTLLQRATGWDARLLALGAVAARASKETGVPAEALYALYRMGLPSDRAAFVRVGAATIEDALKKAVSAGIAGLNEHEIEAARSAYANFARNEWFNTKVPGSSASVDGMLDAAGFSKTDLSRIKFAQLCTQLHASSGKLWEAAEKLGVPTQVLRLQGKLGFLTSNNLKLMSSFPELKNADELATLVDQDLHQPEAWKRRLRKIAGEGDVATLIPPAYTDEKATDPCDSYARDLARKVRLAFPMQTLRRQVETDTLTLGAEHATVKGPVTHFLREATKLGFKLGQQSLGSFIKENEGHLFLSDTTADQRNQAVESLRRLTRLYQMSPSDESLRRLYALGYTSAQEVVAFSMDDFIDHFVPKDTTEADKERRVREARLLYRKAHQISAVAFHFYSAGKQIASAPRLFGLSPNDVGRKVIRDRLIKTFPTLETLFGSTDYCECERCRSVLSPAAYLVDLLRFIDPSDDPKGKRPSDQWSVFLEKWREKHGGPYEGVKPFDELDRRRPDIAQLPLTCENTNTVLPYIDLVNEILELRVAGLPLSDDARDTGSAKTEDLLAEPQQLLPKAYEELKKARCPLALPFDLWTETVRRFLGYFGVPFAQVLELFRPGEALFAPNENPVAYYRDTVFGEQLGLSAVERRVFTDAQEHAEWYRLYGEESDAAALNLAKSAKQLSRRLGVTYKELIDLAQSGFVNLRLDSPDAGCDFDETTLCLVDGTAPAAVELLKLNLFVRLWRKLGWSIDETDRALQAFTPRPEKTPATLANLGEFLRTALVYLAQFKSLEERLGSRRGDRIKLLTLWTDLPTTGRDPLYAQLFLNPTVLATDPVFDDPAGDYLPPPGDGDTERRVGRHLPALQAGLGLSAQDIEEVLTHQKKTLNKAPLDLATVSMLHRHGFLAKALKLSVADLLAMTTLSGVNPFEELKGGLLTASEHEHPLNKTLQFVDAVRAIQARGLTIADLDFVLRHRYDPVGPRRAAEEALIPLLRTLDAELERIRKDTGGGPLDLSSLDDDQLRPVVATLTDEKLREFLAQVFPAEVAATLGAMLVGVWEHTAVQTEVAPADKLDPRSVSDFPRVSVSYDAVRGRQMLTVRGVLREAERAALEHIYAAPWWAKLLSEVQRLANSFFDANLVKGDKPDDLGFLRARDPSKNTNDFDTLFAPTDAGAAKERAAAAAFAAARQAAAALGTEAERTATLAQAQAERTAALTQAQTERTAALGSQRLLLARTFLPWLRARLTRAALVEALATHTGLDVVSVDTLLRDVRVLADLPRAEDGKPGEQAAQSVGNVLADSLVRGVTATWCDASGKVLQTDLLATADTAACRSTPVGAASVRFELLLDVPTSGAWRFHVRLGKVGAGVELRLWNSPDPLLRETAAGDGQEFSKFENLRAGVAIPVAVVITNLGGGGASIELQGEALARGSLDRFVVHPGARVARFRRSVTRLEKIARIAQAFALSAREVRHVALHALDFDGFTWAAIPGDEHEAGTAPTATLFKQLLRLAEYARLKQELAGGTDDLIGVFERARRRLPYDLPAKQGEAPDTTPLERARKKTLDDVCDAFGKVTRREPTSVRDVAEALGFSVSAVGVDAEVSIETKVEDFTSERGLAKLWDALSLSMRLGVSARAIKEWATPSPTEETARHVKNCLRASGTRERWRQIAQPIHDALRQRQRDALVAFTLHQMRDEKVDTQEKLYEILLLDPGMEPVVQTSRLRLAISSVQLFVQRCLLNLEEPRVAPSTIDSKQWEWMKRYRVWEANRKIFLFPENWLEPEFRDDKTHLFQELEGALLQGDVSQELAEDAFYNYLSKLDGIARLDVVAMCREERPNAGTNIQHVVGRTCLQPYKYFYRRHLASEWTPWEPIDVEIEGDHLVAVVWRQRLNLFWVTFMEKGRQNGADTSSPDALNSNLFAGPLREVEAQLNWTELFQGKWSSRSSTGFGKPIRIPIDRGKKFDSRNIFIHATTESRAGAEAVVYIHLTGFDSASEGGTTFRVVSKNAAPSVVRHPEPEAETPPYLPNDHKVFATRYEGAGGLVVYHRTDRVENGNVSSVNSNSLPEVILAGSQARDDQPYFVLPCTSPQEWFITDPTGALTVDLGRFVSPFFYMDGENTFYVEPSMAEKTVTSHDDWVIPAKIPVHTPVDRVPIVPYVPPRELARPPVRSDLVARPKEDWLIRLDTGLRYGNRIIGSEGGGSAPVSRPDLVAGERPGRPPPIIIGGGGLTRRRPGDIG